MKLGPEEIPIGLQKELSMVKHLRRIADALDILNAEKLARSKYELGLISKEDYLLTVIKANQKGEEQ